jgi:hypothetical protein
MCSYEELDDAALEKLAWLIAEEFVDTCDLLSGMDRDEVEKTSRPTQIGVFRMVMHWTAQSAY